MQGFNNAQGSGASGSGSQTPSSSNMNIQNLTAMVQNNPSVFSSMLQAMHENRLPQEQMNMLRQVLVNLQAIRTAQAHQAGNNTNNNNNSPNAASNSNSNPANPNSNAAPSPSNRADVQQAALQQVAQAQQMQNATPASNSSSATANGTSADNNSNNSNIAAHVARLLSAREKLGQFMARPDDSLPPNAKQQARERFSSMIADVPLEARQQVFAIMRQQGSDQQAARQRQALQQQQQQQQQQAQQQAQQQQASQSQQDAQQQAHARQTQMRDAQRAFLNNNNDPAAAAAAAAAAAGSTPQPHPQQQQAQQAQAAETAARKRQRSSSIQPSQANSPAAAPGSPAQTRLRSGAALTGTPGAAPMTPSSATALPKAEPEAGPPARATLTQGLAQHSSLATPGIIKPPSALASQKEDKGVVGKKRLQEMLETIDPSASLDDEVEDLLLDVADEFIESVTRFSCRLAQHRHSERLEAQDVSLHLDKNWAIHLPGWNYSHEGTEATRQMLSRRTNVPPSYAQRVAAVKDAQQRRRLL